MTCSHQTTVSISSKQSWCIKLRDGNLVSGRPLLVTEDNITLKHGLNTTVYRKADIAEIDYLRVKPETDTWDYFAQVAPELLFFLPETYSRLAGWEGRVKVNLFDSSKPETNAPAQ